MRLFASLKIAGRALRRNKMRSLLTMLGIIIGVGAVIGSVSLTSGATKQVEDQVSSLGESVVTVFSGNFTSGGMRGGWGSAPTLTVPDYQAIKSVKNVVALSPEVRDREQVLANGLNWNTQVMGESPDYAQIRNWDIAAGSMFSDMDVRTLAKSAVAKPVRNHSGDVRRHGRQDRRVVDPTPGCLLPVDMEPGDVYPLVRASKPRERGLPCGGRSQRAHKIDLGIACPDGADVDS